VFRWLSVTDSTQRTAERWRAEGAVPPFAVVADRQTAGRGTGSRTWTSPAGGLYLTLTLPGGKNASPTFAGFALGVALADVLKGAGAVVGLKWPNDLLFAPNGRDFGKVAGILGESKQGYVHVGVGVNFRTAPAALPPLDPDASFPAVTLAGQPASERSVEWLATEVVARACAAWSDVLTAGAGALLRRWESHCAHRDRSVRFRDKDGSVFEGRFLGLEADGAAVVATRGERRTFYAGELRCFW
jgi:BirA family biotin operon repressor/biotin-[acetyl-CoA-carboxylase] ligase